MPRPYFPNRFRGLREGCVGQREKPRDQKTQARGSRSREAVPIDPAAADHTAIVRLEASKTYDGISQLDLQLLCVEKDEHAADLQEQLRKTSQSRQFFISRCQRLKDENLMLVQHIDDQRARICWRPGRHITMFGGYNLALRRNLSNAGAGVVATMVAGDEERGSVSDPKTVVAYEHRANAAKGVRAQSLYEAMDNCGCEAILLKCDATNEDCIERRKVHVSLITSYALETLPEPVEHEVADMPGLTERDDEDEFNEGVEGVGTLVPDEAETIVWGHEQQQRLEASVTRCKNAGELQTVEDGTGVETYLFAKRELASVGSPTWEDRAQQSATHPKRISFFLLSPQSQNLKITFKL